MTTDTYVDDLAAPLDALLIEAAFGPLRRLVQAYLATGRTVDQLVADVDLSWRDDQRVRFTTENLLEALSPSNIPLLNPASAKMAIDTMGMSLVRGALNLVRDMATAPRIPEMVDRSAFKVGDNLAATPGAVVLRTEVFELVQYAPQTLDVREVPLLLVPPTINKFYAIDLAPGRSWIEHLVQSGQQVFVLSWRNPDARHADWGLAAAATAMSRRRGYLDGKVLAEVFAFLRPGDLVWNYWVNNYLLGQKPPAFDVLYWNADTTRMTARLHADFVDVALNNRLPDSGGASALGVPVDLKSVDVDAYVVAGIADHITPWQSCYRTTQLLGGQTKFVLSTSGHIAALVNPPGNAKATYRINPKNPADPQQWLQTAATREGSWWPDFVTWLDDRCGPRKDAPTTLGGNGFPPLIEAPGTYVFDR